MPTACDRCSPALARYSRKAERPSPSLPPPYVDPDLFHLLLRVGCSFYPGPAVPYHTIPFEPLDFSDTLRAGELDLLRTHYELIMPDGTYHPLPDTVDANDGLILISERQGVLYDHLVYEEGQRNWGHGQVSRSVDGRYFLVSIRQTNFSRGQESADDELWIIDPRSATVAKVGTYSYSFEYSVDPDTEEETEDKTSAITQVLLKGEELTLLNSCVEESANVPCADPGGVYVIGNGALTRTKDYDPDRLSMVPIRYAGPIATGMWLDEVTRIHPYGSMWTAAQFEYGLEPSYQNDSGLVVTDGNTAMCFVRMREGAQKERIKDIVAISPTYIIGGVHPGNTCSELMALYPEVALRIDPVSGWEIADFEVPPMRITFKTNEKDRVGRYTVDKATGHSVYKSIARPATPIDFITVSAP